MAYRNGTSVGRFSGSGSSFEAGNINISGTSHHQTYLANLTSPPSPPRPFLFSIIAVFVVPFFSAIPLLIAYLGSPFKFVLILLIDIISIAVVFTVCVIFAPGQWKSYRQKYKEWEGTWICLKCGNTFYL